MTKRQKDKKLKKQKRQTDKKDKIFLKRCKKMPKSTNCFFPKFYSAESSISQVKWR